MIRFFDILLIAYVTPLWYWWQASVKIHNLIWHDNLSFKNPTMRSAPTNDLWGLIFVPGLLAYVLGPPLAIQIALPAKYDFAVLLGGALLFTITMIYGLIRRKILLKRFPKFPL